MAKGQYDIDPKTFYKPGPRMSQMNKEVVVPVAMPVNLKSLGNFEGEELYFGKRTEISRGRLETYKLLVNVGASTGLLRNPYLDRTFTVLEGVGTYRTFTVVQEHKDLKVNVHTTELEPGMTVIAPHGIGHKFDTTNSYLVLSVTQEQYYYLEESVEESVHGTPPFFGTGLAPRERRERYQSKAIEQSKLLRLEEIEREKSFEEKENKVLEEDFDPLDPRWHMENAKPYIPK